MSEKDSEKAKSDKAGPGTEATTRTTSSSSQPAQVKHPPQQVPSKETEKVAKKPVPAKPSEKKQEPSKEVTSSPQNVGKKSPEKETKELKAPVGQERKSSQVKAQTEKTPVQQRKTSSEPRRAVSSSSETIPRVRVTGRSQEAANPVSTSKTPLPVTKIRTREPASNLDEQMGLKLETKNAKNKVQVPRARRMQLSLTYVEPWSVAKVSFLLAIAGAVIQVVAASLLWFLLNAIGLFDNITQMVSKTGLDAGGIDLSSVLSLGTVISSVTIFSIFEIIFVVVMATIGAFLYNVVGSLVGGIHVTLGDD